MKVESLKNIEVVKFYDYSEYESSKSRNGGGYGYFTKFTRQQDGRFLLTFHTTAEFYSCPNCGAWEDHRTDDERYKSGYTCGELTILTENELIEYINDFKESEDKYIKLFTKERIEELEAIGLSW